MIIQNPHLCTIIRIFHPRYHDKHNPDGEPVVLLSKNKVYHATPTILVEFTKAKSLQGQRFAISREQAQSYPEETNGRIPVLEVPLSRFENWGSAAEVKAIIETIWPV